MKEFKIQVPEGYEIDRENSTFECIKFKPKELTYDDIVKKLIKPHCYKTVFYRHSVYSGDTPVGNDLLLSERQGDRIQAIIQLMNVAYYFNKIVDKTVIPTIKYIPEIDPKRDIIKIGMYDKVYQNGIVWFKTRESLQKAVKILGKETIKLAISL